ncbi:MAG: hypothetical protein ACOVKO_01840 [Elstera sp.]|jgi:transcription initiation factor TFIIIB Brf1 subunit/transcription initiation factor TFIIB
MTARREFSKRQKAEIVHRAMNERGQICCENCGLVLGRKPFEVDHTIPEALVVDKTKPLTIAEGQLLGKECCHRGGKTAKDVGDIARAVRREAKHLGIRKPSAFRSKWKKKISGEVVLR